MKIFMVQVQQRSVDLLAHQSSSQRHQAARKVQEDTKRHRGKQQDQRSIRQLLEELYGDWKYLRCLLSKEGE